MKDVEDQYIMMSQSDEEDCQKALDMFLHEEAEEAPETASDLQDPNKEVEQPASKEPSKEDVPLSSIKEIIYPKMPDMLLKSCGSAWGTGVNQFNRFCWGFMLKETDTETEGERLIRALLTTSSPVDQCASLDHVERGQVIDTFILGLRRRVSGGGYQCSHKPSGLYKYVDHIIRYSAGKPTYFISFFTYPFNMAADPSSHRRPMAKRRS
jgi:hypothetical protein